MLRAILGTTRNIPLGHTTQHYIPEAPAKSKSWILPASIAAAAAAVILGLGALFMFSGKESSTPSTGGESAAAPAESSASEPSEGSASVLSSSDEKALLGQLGKKVTVQGVVGRVGESNSGKVRYLNFQGSARGDFSLVFFLSPGEREFTKAKLEKYVGKEIRANGVISEYQGTPQMQITDYSQIQIIQ